MKSTAIVLALFFCSGAFAAPQNGKAIGCLIVKHKGTVGRRLMWTALIGVPIAPGSKYDYVDSIGLGASKTAYGGKDLQKMQTDGVHVVVLNNKYSTSDLQDARESCKAAAAFAEAH